MLSFGAMMKPIDDCFIHIVLVAKTYSGNIWIHHSVPTMYSHHIVIYISKEPNIHYRKMATNATAKE